MTTDEELIEGWLSQCRRKQTARYYGILMRHFQEWYGKPLESFLSLPADQKREVALRFQRDALDEDEPWIPSSRLHSKQFKNVSKEDIPGLAQNTVLSVLAALGSLCTYKGLLLPLKGHREDLQADVTSHNFTNGDLGKLFDVGDSQEKALIATMASTGWEISSILNLDRVHISALIIKAKEDGERFIFFQTQRKKEGTARLGVLNPLAIEWLSKWWSQWPNDNAFMITSNLGFNRMLRRLVKNAQLTVTGRVRSHRIRAWLMSKLSSAGFNEYQINFIMGKKIPLSKRTYLTTLPEEIKARYPEAYDKYLNIQPERTVTVIDKQKEREIEELKRKLAQYEGLEARFAKMEKILGEMKKTLE